MRIRPTRATPQAGAYRAAGHWRAELLDDLLNRAAAAHPRRTALTDDATSVTYGQLADRVARAAGMLAGLGVARGDVVTFQLPNWIEAAVVLYATLRLGAIANPVIPIYRERELQFILERSGSRVLIVPDAFRGFDHRALAGSLRPRLPELAEVLVVGEAGPGTTSFADCLAAADPAPADPDRAASDIALLLYTSCTESDPKGVLHSHETLAYECRSVIELYAVSEADRVFMPSPVTHITGLLYGLVLPFMVGAASTLQAVWDPGRALELIERDRASFTVAATPFLHGILHHPRRGEHDLSSLRVFVCGGADVPPTLIAAARDELGVAASRVYGASECPTVTGTPLDADAAHQVASDGRAIEPTRLRIVDEAGGELAAGEVGAVEIQGPDMFLGYLDASLNAAAFTTGGWFSTGDLARADADGYVTVAGRAKDIILRGGENLSAKEIEDLIHEHPAVVEVAVVGAPDPVLGERACAFVVARAPLTLEELVAFLRERRMAAQKLPERLLLRDHLPTNASGKVQKFRLRAELSALRGTPTADQRSSARRATDSPARNSCSRDS